MDGLRIQLQATVSCGVPQRTAQTNGTRVETSRLETA